MTFWRAYGWTAVVVVNWLVVGHAVLGIRRDIAAHRAPRASWLIPAAAVAEQPVGEGRYAELSLTR